MHASIVLEAKLEVPGHRYRQFLYNRYRRDTRPLCFIEEAGKSRKRKGRAREIARRFRDSVRTDARQMLSPVPAGNSKSLYSIQSTLIDWRSQNGFKEVVPRCFALARSSMLLVFLMKFCCVTPVGRCYPSWLDSHVYFDGFARQGNRSCPWGSTKVYRSCFLNLDSFFCFYDIH